MSPMQALSLKPDNNIALISISDEGQILNFSEWKDILYLKFFDLEIYHKNFTSFDSLMAKNIQEFTVGLHRADRPINLIIHCEAGISRSAAVACWVSNTYGLELPENFKIRTSPNKLVLAKLFELTKKNSETYVNQYSHKNNVPSYF